MTHTFLFLIFWFFCKLSKQFVICNRKINLKHRGSSEYLCSCYNHNAVFMLTLHFLGAKLLGQVNYLLSSENHLKIVETLWSTNINMLKV